MVRSKSPGDSRRRPTDLPLGQALGGGTWKSELDKAVNHTSTHSFYKNAPDPIFRQPKRQDAQIFCTNAFNKVGFPHYGATFLAPCEPLALHSGGPGGKKC